MTGLTSLGFADMLSGVVRRGNYLERGSMHLESDPAFFVAFNPDSYVLPKQTLGVKT